MTLDERVPLALRADGGGEEFDLRALADVDRFLEADFIEVLNPLSDFVILRAMFAYILCIAFNCSISLVVVVPESFLALLVMPDRTVALSVGAGLVSEDGFPSTFFLATLDFLADETVSLIMTFPDSC